MGYRACVWIVQAQKFERICRKLSNFSLKLNGLIPSLELNPDEKCALRSINFCSNKYIKTLEIVEMKTKTNYKVFIIVNISTTT